MNTLVTFQYADVNTSHLTFMDHELLSVEGAFGHSPPITDEERKRIVNPLITRVDEEGIWCDVPKVVNTLDKRQELVDFGYSLAFVDIIAECMERNAHLGSQTYDSQDDRDPITKIYFSPEGCVIDRPQWDWESQEAAQGPGRPLIEANKPIGFSREEALSATDS